MAENVKPVLSLKTVLVPSKNTEVEFPGMPGFVISLTYLSREVLVNLRKKSTKTTFKNRAVSEELNEDLFLSLYVDAAIKGWKGLKASYLEQLAPVDISGVDPDTELPFSHDEALGLMKSSVSFDQFVTETVGELGNFSNSSTKK